MLFVVLAGRRGSGFRLVVRYVVFACRILGGVGCRSGSGGFVRRSFVLYSSGCGSFFSLVCRIYRGGRYSAYFSRCGYSVIL